jgi:signal transduction histidine kinase
MHNPMSSIKLALSGLKGSENLNDREAKKVELVLGEVDRLESLLSETLDYVRPVKLSDEPVNLADLIDQVIQQLEPVLDEKGLVLEHQGTDKPAMISIDKSQFHQVLLNLIKNAIEASSKGGLIKTELKSFDDVVSFQISNGGKTMDEETLNRAFEPFYTTKPKGTGLGLGLVKRVVDEHGGNVQITSDSENGTQVMIQLYSK